MKRVAFLLILCVCLFTPGVARADDGGFWDMLFHWDTKFSGYGTDFHALCLTKSGERVKGCEELFRNFWNVFHPRRSDHHFSVNSNPFYSGFVDIKHEFNFRVSYMRSYGQRIPDAALAPNDDMKDDTRRVNAWKLLGMYYLHVGEHWQLGGGGGAIPIYGKDVPLFWRRIATASVIYFPCESTSSCGVWYVRVEGSYLTNTITGAMLGHPTSSFSKGPGPNLSATVGFDVRRVGNFNEKTAKSK